MQANKLWLGYRNINSDMWFELPGNTEKYEKIIDGKKVKHIMACWLTNLDTTKRHQMFDMYKKYTPEQYPTYDNYDAINVNVVAEIPGDYDGVIGVPLTFIDKYNPDQFEILGITDRHNSSGVRNKVYTIDDAANYNDLNRQGVLRQDDNYKMLYHRILIKRKDIK